jgi:small subunit ribosomal protein S1
MTQDKSEQTSAETPGALAGALEESLRKEKSKRFRKGDRVSGRIYKIGETMAFVDLGGRSEGMIDLAEHRKPDGSMDIEEGQDIEGIVTDVAANGVILKRSLVTQHESVQQLLAAQAAGITVPAKVTGQNKGGLELDLFGLRAFCPGSQIETHKVDDFSGYIGQTFQFRIQEISKDGKKIVLSRRALMLEEHEKEVAELKTKLTPGAIIKGKVVRLQPFGAFIDLGGIEGLCHVSELTRARIHNASEAVKVGDEIEVQILKIEEATDKSGRKSERIALSHKILEKDPWADAPERFPVGSKVTGKVARLQPFGAFIEIAPGIDGLVHVSEISTKRIEHPREALKEGDEVTATVLAVEPDKQRLSLTLKEPRKAEPKAPRAERGERSERRPGAPAGGPPREPRAAGARPPRRERPAPAAASDAPAGEPKPQKPHYSKGQVHDATVEKVEQYGVFVTLPGGGRALVPNNELGVNKNADQKVDFRKFFPAGATVRIAITQVDHRGQIRASKVEAERADERSLVREWASTQKQAGGTGFGTLGDLFKSINLNK